MKPLRLTTGAIALRRLTRALQPNVVHAHYVSSYGVMAAASGHSRVLQTAWGSDLLVDARTPPRRWLTRAALRRAVMATADSDSVLDAIRALAPELPLHKFVFGPPSELFARPRAKEPIILSVRSHEPNYRIELVLDTWQVLEKALPQHTLVVAGSGSLSEALRRQAGKRVSFVGDMPHDQLMELMLRAEVMMSLPISDATSASVLEALAAGCAVVASSLPANQEWIPSVNLAPLNAGAKEIAELVIRARSDPGSLSDEWSIEKQVRLLVDKVAGMT